ncbi:MAG TPA: EAL domain-containing protein [Fontimonas sp.]
MSIEPHSDQRFDAMSASALLKQMPQPIAVLDARGDTVHLVNQALVERAQLGETQLRELNLQSLAKAFSEATSDTGYTHPIQYEGREALLWMADHQRPELPVARDPTTGLTVRAVIEKRMRSALSSHSSGALLRIEVDQFLLINDAYGIQAANELLAQLGALFIGQMRGCGEPTWLGGGDFLVQVTHPDPVEAWRLAERMRLQVAAQGFEWRGNHYGVTISIGLAYNDGAYFDFNELMSAAEVACRAARERGRNRIEQYRSSDHAVSRMRGEQSWGGRVLAALENSTFALYRQRIDPVLSGVSAPHYEVLLRLPAAAGWTTPVEFVAAAERYGLMPQLDRRIIVRVLRELSRLPVEQRPVTSVNLSAHSLGDLSMVAYIERMLERFEVHARHLCLEITETAAIANTAQASAMVKALKTMGCRVALDDFGAGMSSFSYLKTLNVDTLKIDGSFVRNVAHDAVDAATIESMVKVARLRGLTTVAECVEDGPSLQRLGELGVDYAQGFYLHRPETWSLP